MAAAPSRDDRRTILHLDYDCFYASVFEVEQPVLKTLPLAVQQKQIVVTCNYEARRRGLRKLQLIREAKQICPDVVIVLGEDLSKFRDASKEIFLYIKSFVWGERVERLGFDELFLDVTEMIAYNVDLLNRHDLERSFFHLDRLEPTVGFTYDATRVCGSTYPAGPNTTAPSATADEDASGLRTRLLVASHLAGYLRGQLEHHKGYTATVGISTSKLLAKLVGSTHKPNNQTTLLPPYVTTEPAAPGNVADFVDAHEIRKIPGIGSKLTRKLTNCLTDGGAQSGSALASDVATNPDRVTVRDVRLLPGMGPSLLDRILGGSGAPRDIGARVWGLLSGVDNAEVIQTGDLPTQISIEDSYGRLDTLDGVRKELILLTGSLLRRMRTDLTEKDNDADSPTDPSSETSSLSGVPKVRWLARPRTLRLSTRPRSTIEGTQALHIGRISRSAPLPGYAFHVDENVDALAERLVHDQLLSMFRKLHPERSEWNLRLMNVAVTNMVDAAGDRKQSSGRDIGKMFQSQGLRRIAEPETVSERGSMNLHHAETLRPACSPAAPWSQVENDAWEESDGEDRTMACVACAVCGALIPHFAREAHEMFHMAPD
ncbi:DNA/RNA polymerase [Aspergillus sclerotioniger CBS 115572]|uniref:DNA/RNA polymerase n=1 Tax=Aspergillus sclerotioniger CBS 115572 TaxID=1450535 RepID=A0A317WQY4_9EURO|nr:DNA/RNA polymerase [Aspergillus sclerotioniger CBS 115572]PWY87328.1 DNA/RNA polymerase [Aspergillus sclerotioniger CBS 115572]